MIAQGLPMGKASPYSDPRALRLAAADQQPLSRGGPFLELAHHADATAMTSAAALA
jgi:hypothetical protein